jgi:hypothetical protein
MRPIFFAPWWWYLWSSGKRFSLRRTISLATVIAILAEVVAVAALYAFRGKTPSLAAALPVAAWAAAASVAVSLCEPVVSVVTDSLRAGRWSPDRLREVSYGLQTAYAAALAVAAYALAPHVPFAERLLLQARAQNGWNGGTARYLIGATLVFVPIVIALRFIALAIRPRPAASPAAASASAETQSMPYVRRSEIPPKRRAPLPTEMIPRQQPPARIVNVVVAPADPKDTP